MTFKATIKVGGGEVSTTSCDDVTLVTPAGHAIGGATAAYAYDRLHDLVGKYCAPGTKRGNGLAGGMGQALGFVFGYQLAVIERQEKELKSLRNELASFERERDEARSGLRDFSNLSQRLETELREAKAELRRVREYKYAPPAAPTPAVTKDTPVTLGMLQGLCEEAMEERARRNGYHPEKDPMHMALDRKLGGR